MLKGKTYFWFVHYTYSFVETANNQKTIGETFTVVGTKTSYFPLGTIMKRGYVSERLLNDHFESLPRDGVRDVTIVVTNFFQVPKETYQDFNKNFKRFKNTTSQS